MNSISTLFLCLLFVLFHPDVRLPKGKDMHFSEVTALSYLPEPVKMKCLTPEEHFSSLIDHPEQYQNLLADLCVPPLDHGAVGNTNADNVYAHK